MYNIPRKEYYTSMFQIEFYPKAKRTPSIGAAGYYRMGGDEFAQ